MKVKTRKYATWLGPYQAVERILFWAKKEDENGIPETPEWVSDIGEKVAESWLGGVISSVAGAWVNFHDKRRIKVRIEEWDTWDMDYTLAHIILPLLKQLRRTKHGAPHVDLTDVPRRLHPTELGNEENGYVDNTHFDRWNYILDEMIFAFETKAGSLRNWESQFESGVSETLFVPVDADGNDVPEEEAEFFQMRRGPNDTSKIDWEGRKAYMARISNGFRLFGKYYESLWD